MAIAESTALRDFLMESGSRRRALKHGVLELYSGTRPANADLAPTGTLLCVMTLSGGAHTPEVFAQGYYNFLGVTGNITAFNINAASGNIINLIESTVNFDTDVATTVLAVVAAINNGWASSYVKAAVGGVSSVVLLTARPGTRGIPGLRTGSTLAIAVSAGSTGTASPVSQAMGVTAAAVAPVNGLTWGASTDGVMVPTGVWSGIGLNAAGAGTAATWARYKCAREGTRAVVGDGGPAHVAGADDNSDDSTTKVYMRMDMDVSTEAAGTGDVQLPDVTIVDGDTYTLSLAGSSLTHKGTV